MRKLAFCVCAFALSACTSYSHLPTLVGDKSYKPWGTDNLLLDSNMHVLPTPLGTSQETGSFDVIELINSANSLEERALSEGSTEEQPTEAAKLAKKERNDVQNILLLRSDQLCSRYVTALLSGRDTFNYLVPLIGPFTTAAAESLKNLGSIGSLVESFGSFIGNAQPQLLKEDLLAAAALTSAIKQIRITRANLATKIRNDAQSQTIETYSLSQALLDANRYHRYCNFYDAWQSEDQTVKAADAAIPIVPNPTTVETTTTTTTTSTTPAMPTTPTQ